MKQLQTLFFFTFLGIILSGHAQNEGQDRSDDYLEFNDRKNVVHGVYLGLDMRYGQIDDKDAYLGGLKLAYVANQQFEVGFEGNFIYSDQEYFNTALGDIEDLIGAYGGLHLEPILFSKSLVNLSFPLLIGGGGVGYIDRDIIENDDIDQDLTEDDFDPFFLAEPGVSALFNISRYLQVEAGVKYRFTSKVTLRPNGINNLNGWSAGVGIKVGVFNMGRNRYKKNIGDEE
ncbi:hypothetical protein ACEZ3G_09885 [Maribacter algicola]|uniref:Uncharacterized protein n=1 Tax=Meishania litoralis TaxID=3434685 RepID=A0ACC7LKM0_9FLAO